MNTDEINNVESAESERLLSGNTVQAHIYGSKDPVRLYSNCKMILDLLGFCFLNREYSAADLLLYFS